jgi:hypothetical protein
VQLSRSSLCNLLLEDGEEDLAVLVARADLPDVLDTGRDGTALAALGLGRDQLEALLPAVAADGEAPADDTGDAAVRRTLSSRWARLVSSWTAPSDRGSDDRRGEP